MEIKTVAVLGAGAVGSYIIWGLDKKVKLGVIGVLTIRQHRRSLPMRPA